MISGAPAAAWRGPVALIALLLALFALWAFGGDRDRFYRSQIHDWNSAMKLAMAERLQSGHWFLAMTLNRRPDGTMRHVTYNRFPIGGHLLIKLATAPFEGNLKAHVLAGRALMLALYCGAAVLAYLALVRLAGSRAVALAATLLTFSSYHMLRYSDMICTEGSVDLFGVMLAFHGMARYETRTGRAGFGQLLAQVLGGALLGWRVYALLLAFIAFGLCREAAGDWRRRRTDGRIGWLATVGRLARSRYTLLGLLAALFGAGLVGYNLATDRAAFGAHRSWTELPTAQSLARRFGQSRQYNAILAEAAAWPNFLGGQLHRLGGMVLPYALAGPRDEQGELPWTGMANASLAPIGGGASVLCLGLLLWRRERFLLAALAASGFCWALIMRYNTADPTHGHESLAFVGLPLAFHTLLLLALRRLPWMRSGGAQAGCAAVAAGVFAVSSWQMGRAGGDPAGAAFERRQRAEFQAIRGAIQGKDVLATTHVDAVYRFAKAPGHVRTRRPYSWPMVDDSGRIAFFYYTAGAVMRYADPLREAAIVAAEDAPDFILAFERFDTPSLLTPGNQHVFLYDSTDVLDALRNKLRKRFATIAATAPVATTAPAPRGANRRGWSLHAYADRREQPAARRRRLAFLKAGCAPRDVAGPFALNARPVDARRAGEPLATADGFVRLRAVFTEHGVRFDDKCLLEAPLPSYRVGAARASQYAPGGATLWRVHFHLDMDGLRRAAQAALATQPVARAGYDVYRAGKTLLYYRAGCAGAERTAKFFLHVVPRATGDLRRERRRQGFDNLDFRLEERGAWFDGNCVARVTLPDYRVARVRTGQFESGVGELWRVEIAGAE